MAVRAGAGIFYGSITGNEWNTTADNQPFTVRQTFPTVFTLSDPYRNLPGGVAPFPFNYDPANPRFTLPAQVFGPSLDFVWPYSYQMNLTVEKEILAASARAPRTSERSDASCPRASTGTIPVFGPRRDDGQRQRATPVSARRDRPGARARIDLQQRLPRPAAQRRTARHAVLCQGLLHLRQGDGGRRLPGRRASRGAELEPPRPGARAHVRRSHAHSSRSPASGTSTTCETATPVVKALLNDWTVSTIVTLQSGTPLTITAGTDRNFDGLTNDRADVIGDPELDPGRPREELIEQWFDTAAFAQPAIGHDGTAGRSIVEGPGIKNVDLGVFRDIRLLGRTMFQFRLEATNVLNMVNLQNPGTSLNAPATFGKIRSARDMRRIQLGARVRPDSVGPAREPALRCLEVTHKSG